MTRALLIIVLIFNIVQAGEWSTSGGQYCIEKCQYHNDGHHFYWCHVTDVNRAYTDGAFSSSWGYSDRDGPDTHLKWDYCVPSVLDEYIEYDERPNSNKPNYNNDMEDDVDEGGHGHYPIIPKGPSTTLYKFTECTGECTLRNMRRPTCPVGANSNHPLTFPVDGRPSYYCVNELAPERVQLSARYRLWCLDTCRRGSESQFFCTTLYGYDDCSPRPDVDVKGKSCAYPCQFYDDAFQEYYFCYTARDNSTWDYCGYWNVPQEKKQVIEFTRYDYVCADFCQEDEDQTYEWCHYVYWDYNYTTNEATLHKTWDYCEGHVKPGMEGWQIALIILGVVAAIGVLVGIGAFLSK